MKNTPDRLQELLVARRNQIPGDDYFRTVLPDFHRRLRNQAIRRSSLLEILMERFNETLLPGVSPVWRMAGAACVLAVACLMTIHPAGSPIQPHLLTFESPSLTLNQQGVKYSLSEAGDLDLTTKVDQQLDRVSLTDVRTLQTNFMAEEAPAHYVLTNHPVTYDTVAAF